MLFKKKKKDEQVIEEVTNPFGELEVSSQQEEIIPVTEVPICEIKTTENVTEMDNNINSDFDSNKENLNELNNNPLPNMNLEDNNENFNEIHPISLAEEEEKINYKNIDVDDLIKDIKLEEYCPNCGSKINEDSDVCFICGTSID